MVHPESGWGEAKVQSPARPFAGCAEFAAGAPALAILSFAALLAALSTVLHFSLIAIDRPRAVLVADAVVCAIALGAYLALIPPFSLVGAALDTAMAEASELFAMLWGLRRAGQPLPRFSALGKALVAGVAAAAGIWLITRLSLHWMPALVIGGALYVGLLAVTGPYRENSLIACENVADLQFLHSRPMPDGQLASR